MPEDPTMPPPHGCINLVVSLKKGGSYVFSCSVNGNLNMALCYRHRLNLNVQRCFQSKCVFVAFHSLNLLKYEACIQRTYVFLCSFLFTSAELTRMDNMKELSVFLFQGQRYMKILYKSGTVFCRCMSTVLEPHHPQVTDALTLYLYLY